MIRLADGLYRALLWLLPPQDRRRFGEEMAAALARASRVAARTEGWRGVVRVTASCRDRAGNASPAFTASVTL